MLAQSPATFPVVTDTAPPEAVGEFARRAKKSAPRRVLVVDDEPLIRWMVAETLGPSGYDVEQASDAHSAIRALLDGPNPDVVLLDLRLPDSTDLWLLQTLRELAPTAAIILMTAFGTPEVRDEALRLGACCVLEKPFEIDDLNRLVCGPRP